MKNVLKVAQPDKIAEVAESFELKIAERFLKSQFFEKRVKGMNEFKEIIKRIRLTQAGDKDPQTSVKWLNYERFSEWVVQANIIEFIFVENVHTELIKRSGDVI